jgi:hypothetical protein
VYLYDVEIAFLEDIPASVPRLIDAALVVFDADQDTSRRSRASSM